MTSFSELSINFINYPNFKFQEPRLPDIIFSQEVSSVFSMVAYLIASARSQLSCLGSSSEARKVGSFHKKSKQSWAGCLFPWGCPKINISQALFQLVFNKNFNLGFLILFLQLLRVPNERLKSKHNYC